MKVDTQDLHIELFNKNEHLAELTLYRLLGQPHNVARSKSMEYNDLLQCAYEGLWRACITYDENQSNFETYAINHIRWSLKDGTNREDLIKYNVNNPPDKEDRFILVGYDTPVLNVSDSGDEPLTHSEVVADINIDIEQSVIEKSVSDRLLAKLNERERQIVLHKADGRTDKEISELFNVTQQAINRTLHNIRDKMNNEKEEIFNWQ